MTNIQFPHSIITLCNIHHKIITWNSPFALSRFPPFWKWNCLVIRCSPWESGNEAHRHSSVPFPFKRESVSMKLFLNDWLTVDVMTAKSNSHLYNLVAILRCNLCWQMVHDTTSLMLMASEASSFYKMVHLRPTITITTNQLETLLHVVFGGGWAKRALYCGCQSLNSVCKDYYGWVNRLKVLLSTDYHNIRTPRDKAWNWACQNRSYCTSTESGSGSFKFVTNCILFQDLIKVSTSIC